MRRCLRERAGLKTTPKFLSLLTKWNFGANNHEREYRRRERSARCEVWEGLMMSSA